MSDTKEGNKEILESLSPNERKVLPHLSESFEKIIEKTGLDSAGVLRALEYLGNKKIVELKIITQKIISLGKNGLSYKKHGLPERKLINLIAERKKIKLANAKQESNLDDKEFQASLGALKKKAMINLKEGEIIFNGTKEEISKKTLEEQFLEALPKPLEQLKPEEKYSLDILKERKEIIEITNKNNVTIQITPLGRVIAKDFQSQGIKHEDLIETITPELITSGKWKNRKFRRYDIKSPVPKITGGRRHFVNQATDYARKVWSELGFKEMTGNLCQTGFWNFDALFTPQDHPVREIQDTFYIKNIKGKLPDKKIINKIKQSHEQGIGGSKGWQYQWNEEEPKKILLRTHTTCLSALTIASLKKESLPAKFFAVGKCFRNETIDWSHGFEFNQTEGIVVDKNANFKNLLGYLKEFYKKMGFAEVKFVPSFFPYTEPSVEIYGYNSLKQCWIEIGGAGIFRPEVVIPLFGEYIPVLAWGPGFDRALMEYYGIQDLRELYENNLEKLRKMKIWGK
jgi:phenylalanyl-tRNA synthetase alpha chain